MRAAGPVGYALPVPVGLVAADPRLIGEGGRDPRRTERQRPAGPVALHVAAGTDVEAVTAGTITVIPGGNGASTIVLSGADGATYTYRHVIGGQQRRVPVDAGARIAVSGPGGFTFAISVPDVGGMVDAAEALQAWAAGLTIDVRSLPDSVAPPAPPARRQVLLVTDAGAGPSADLAAELATTVAGQFVTVKAITLKTSTLKSIEETAAGIGRQRFARHPALIVFAIRNGTPAQAQAIATRLPSERTVLWVAPPGTTPTQAAAYRAIVAAHPGFRVESLPAALAAVNTPVRALATATLVSDYASTAYRLPSSVTSAETVVGWAERQLGKPYQWAAAGPGSFDCSGLTMDALAQAGIAVTHNANAQWQQTRANPVPANRLAVGDLVFFAGSDGTLTAPGHVGIYVGDGEIIDAPFTGAKVRLDPLTRIGGYVGATNPFAFGATAPIPPGGIPAGGIPAGPAIVNPYQGFARTLANSAWGPGQFGYLNLLWERESGWNPAAANPVSGAFGIPQALPAMKMAAAGPDWATNPYTQIIWGIGYIRAAYGTPRAAWAHELAYGWY